MTEARVVRLGWALLAASLVPGALFNGSAAAQEGAPDDEAVEEVQLREPLTGQRPAPADRQLRLRQAPEAQAPEAPEAQAPVDEAALDQALDDEEFWNDLELRQGGAATGEPAADEGWDEADDGWDDAEDVAAQAAVVEDAEDGAAEEPLVGDEHEHGAAEHGAAEHEPGAEGEHAEHAPFDLGELLSMVVNFLIWLAIIVWLMRKPMTEFLKNRRHAVEEGLEEAKRLKLAAETKYADYSERLEHLDEELAKLRSEMINAGEAERDRIVADAESRAARMRKDAQFVIDQRVKQLRVDLTREAIEAAVAAAETVLTAQVAGSDQQRLADGYLEDVQASIEDEQVQA